MKKLLFVIALLSLMAAGLQAQTRLVDKVQVFDAPNGKSVMIDKATGLSSNQKLEFPVAAGSAGQVLSVSSVSGSTLTLGWNTEAVTTASLSDRLTTDQQVAVASTPTGLVVSVGANKKYRVAGVIRGNRINSGTPSDGIKFTISGPTNTTKVSISVRCYNCSANTSGVPTQADAGATTVTTGAIDPAGSGSSDYTTFAYGIEGLVLTGSTAGNVSVILDDNGSGDNDVFIAENSYLVVTEIN
jgi:hypothetical protein